MTTNKNQIRVTSYLEDVLSAAPNMGGCDPSAVGGQATRPGFTQFAGSYAPDECQLGMLGGSEYYRAYRESELARMAPDVLARSVKSTWDDNFVSLITPDKPAPVSLAGYDVFGPQSFTSTTRNMTLDLRGEAAYAPNLSGEMPVGASVSSLAMGAAMNFADCDQGCGCQVNPAGIQLPGTAQSVGRASRMESSGNRLQKCKDMCQVSTAPGSERTNCLRSCAQDVPMSNRLAMAGSNQDLEQDCFNSCDASGTGMAMTESCKMACKENFGRGGKVASVHPIEFFVPAAIKPATILQPYHISQI